MVTHHRKNIIAEVNILWRLQDENPVKCKPAAMSYDLVQCNKFCTIDYLTWEATSLQKPINLWHQFNSLLSIPSIICFRRKYLVVDNGSLKCTWKFPNVFSWVHQAECYPHHHQCQYPLIFSVFPFPFNLIQDSCLQVPGRILFNSLLLMMSSIFPALRSSVCVSNFVCGARHGRHFGGWAYLS